MGSVNFTLVSVLSAYCPSRGEPVAAESFLEHRAALSHDFPVMMGLYSFNSSGETNPPSPKVFLVRYLIAAMRKLANPPPHQTLNKKTGIC